MGRPTGLRGIAGSRGGTCLVAYASMKSRAHLKGHPLHPMLIVFPIAFLVGCAVADAVGMAVDRPTLWTVGGYLSVAGVVMGLVAGVPGFVDYVTVVPPASSAKKRATYHMVVNVGALGLVALGWAFRDWTTMRPGAAAVVLEWAGVGLMSVGGWLGGTLAYRNQIGVDRRYANAGKPREVTVDGAAGELVVVPGAAAELKPGQMWLVKCGSRRLVLARTDNGLAAFDDRCPHRGGSLADGALVCGTVQCPWHGSQFDVTSGSVKAGPATEGIATHSVEESGGEVRVRLPQE
ncbi:MAG TPA: DUF2231 domain-containing protein [Tepidisphaeraceae bacterium]|nr:DUF2231 domain-containing protein [Tepidisphaeraceae bacterium]